MATQKITPLQACSQHRLQLTYEQFALFAEGDCDKIVNACKADRVTTKSLLIFLVTARNEKLLDAAQASDVTKRLLGELDSEHLLYLWGHQHEGFMWLYNRSTEWRNGLMNNSMPWREILDATPEHPEWNDDLASIFQTWRPHQIHALPIALKYMHHPTEFHVLMAACGAQGGYMDPKQIDALRPGASEWFNMRKNLVPEENRKQAGKAFQLWWHQGQTHHLDGLDGALFQSANDELTL